jgi:hypothetical protein
MMNYHALFTILIIVSTTTTRTTHPPGRLGYAPDPLIRASALCSVRMQDTGARRHPPNQSQPQVQRTFWGPMLLQGLRLASSAQYDELWRSWDPSMKL